MHRVGQGKRTNLGGKFYESPFWWDCANFYDYAYSFLVFQHVEDFSVIKSYISRTSCASKHKGITQLQFDT